MFIFKDLEKDKGLCANVSNIEEIANIRSEIKRNKVYKYFTIKVNRDVYDDRFLKELYDLSKNITNLGFDVSVVIDGQNMQFSKSDMDNFENFEKMLNAENVEFYFSAGNEYYYLNEVLNAYKFIRDLADEINKTKASPLEKFLMIYNALTIRVYKESETTEGSREIISVLNGDEIVCVGYSNLMIRLCVECGIECFAQGCYVEQNGNCVPMCHRNNLVYIKDKKYAIDGLFYSDACWDSIEKGKENYRTYNYCLLPLFDINKMKGLEIEIRKPNNYYYDNPNMFKIYNDYKNGNGFNYGYIEQKSHEFFDVAKDEFIDDDKRKIAINKLVRILKKHNIPCDVYEYFNKNDPCVNLNYLLALSMLGSSAEDELEKQVKKIKGKLREKKSENNINQSKIKGRNNCNKNIYDYLDYLKRQTSTKETCKSVLDGCTQEELNRAMQENDKEFLKNIKIRKMVNKEIRVPKDWLDAENVYIELLTCSKLEKEIKDRSVFDEIPFDVFKKALKRSFILLGYTEKQAEYETDAALKRSEEIAELLFESDAENCFSKYALSKKQRQRT